MGDLRISKDLTLPSSAITETFGVLAVRGAGKTNTCRVMAEEMFAAGAPFVAVDPVGSWRGLRSSRDGKSPGLPIPIFGGKHGDVPLERGGGQLLADLVVDQRLSCVLDLSTFESEAAKKAFLLDFARRLYLRNEEPLHLFLEEADDYIPQRPMRDEALLLRAWENIVRRGRSRGLGVTLITQRSASINKSVLTQVQTLIAMRTTGPQDRAAIEAWLKYHDQSQEILASLPKLEDGEAWVWSPTFLHKTVRVRFRLSNTLDSGATPKLGKGVKVAATIADVDLGAITKQMAATLAKAKADDPRELRRRIAELEKSLAAKAPPPALERVEVPIFDPVVRQKLDAIAGSLDRAFEALQQEVERAGFVISAMLEAARAADERSQLVASKPDRARPKPLPEAIQPRPAETLAAKAQRLGANGTARRGPEVAFAPGERAILTAVAQHRDGVTREQLSVLTGYKRSSRDTYLQRLRSSGYVEQSADRIVVTALGVRALGPDFEPLPTGAKLRAHWLERLPGGERAIFEVLIRSYPKAVERSALDDATGYRRSSRDTYIQRLRARQLVTVIGGAVRASEELF